MSLQVNEENDGKVLVIRVSDRLTKEDYAHFVPEVGSHLLPCQSIRFLGTAPSIPSHHGSLVSEFMAVFVKSVG